MPQIQNIYRNIPVLLGPDQIDPKVNVGIIETNTQYISSNEWRQKTLQEKKQILNFNDKKLEAITTHVSNGGVYRNDITDDKVIIIYNPNHENYKAFGPGKSKKSSNAEGISQSSQYLDSNKQFKLNKNEQTSSSASNNGLIIKKNSQQKNKEADDRAAAEKEAINKEKQEADDRATAEKVAKQEAINKANQNAKDLDDAKKAKQIADDARIAAETAATNAVIAQQKLLNAQGDLIRGAGDKDLKFLGDGNGNGFGDNTLGFKGNSKAGLYKIIEDRISKKSSQNTNTTPNTTPNTTYNVKNEKIDKSDNSSLAPAETKNIMKSLAEVSAELSSKVPHLNMSNLLNKKPYFIKSYSVFERLTPYIRCYVVTKDFNDNNRNNLVKTFFDIPYNMIKSLSVEYESGFGTDGKFTLKLDDVTGQIANVMSAYFYLLGYTQDSSNISKIHLQFGWAENGLKKLNSKDYNKIFYKNFFSEFNIQKLDIEYTENFKQELTLVGKQEKTGVDPLVNSPNSNYTPLAYLGKYPVQNLALLLHYNYLQAHNANTYFKTYLSKPLNQKEINIIQRFKSLQPIPSVLKKHIENQERDNQGRDKKQKIINNLEDINIDGMQSIIRPNIFLNAFSFHDSNQETINAMKGLLTSYMPKATSTYYIMFCYILNIYINEVLYDIETLELKRNESGGLNNILLNFFNESKILRYQLTNFKGKFSDYCEAEIMATYKGKKGNLIPYNFQISESDTWGGLFDNMCGKIQFLNEPNQRLYISYNKYIIESDDKNKNLQSIRSKEKNEGLSIKNNKTLIRTFENLKENIRKRFIEYEKKNKDKPNKTITDNYTNVIKDLQKQIDLIGKQKEDFRCFVITYGTDFVSENNMDDILILQKYTVFPKINSSANLKNQIFFSGKDKLLDGSFPDVIYFRPKIDFIKKIAAFTNTVENKEFHQGYISFRGSEKFELGEGIDEKIDIKEKLEKLYFQLDEINKWEKPFKLTMVQSGEFYTINDSILMKGITVSDVYEAIKKTSPFTLEAADETGKEREKNQPIIIAINILRNAIKSYISHISTSFNFKNIDHLFNKTINVSTGDNSESSYYSFTTLVNNFNYQLAKNNLPFEAELKILGEPAFTFSSAAAPAIYVEVNNVDGSKNNFLSGAYRILKLKHDIDNQGYTTTLTLSYIPSSDEKKGISNETTAVIEGTN